MRMVLNGCMLNMTAHGSLYSVCKEEQVPQELRDLESSKRICLFCYKNTGI